MAIKSADIANEYVKNKDLKEEDVVALKEWVKRQPYLPQMSELQIILFLQSCYCKVEPAKQTIDAFFSLKAIHWDVFTNLNPNSQYNTECMDVGLYAKLPKLTPEGYDVLFFKFMDDDPHKFSYADQLKLFDMCMKLWLEQDGTSKGLQFIIYLDKFSFAHLGKLGLSVMKVHVTYLQEALPVRLKGIHIVHSGVVIEKAMAIVKPFLKKELADLLYLHKDISETLFKFVPQECLPRDFGGDADCLKELHDAMKQKLRDNADFFIRDEKQVADLSKKVSRSNSVTEDIEVDGSFRKLNID